MLNNLLNDFLTGFQFLTRIYIKTNLSWSPESFGRSVKFFPLIGGIIGLILAGIAYGTQQFFGHNVPVHFLAAALILCEVMITGGLHCDGFMDTADGVFSGRSRERMLEIMKDSRVGAFGAISFCLLVLFKYSLLLDIAVDKLPVALLVMPIIGRMASVLAITRFPYVRQEGLGKNLFLHSGKGALSIAAFFTVVMLVPLGSPAFTALAAGLICTALVARYVMNKLGGMTGDVYGAIIELAEVSALLAFCLQR
ncbi:adenosylcobinamide-GDP ribazoletransferase [bacterium BFN5]|nr:adenosylcobinamide-GDP ribazoletransferase [bacterium BFN5]